MNLRDLDIELFRHLRLLSIVVTVLLLLAAALGWYGQSDGTGRSFMIGLMAMFLGPVFLGVMAIVAVILICAGRKIARRSEDVRQARLAAWSAPLVLALAVLVALPINGQTRILRLQTLVSDNLDRMERLRHAPEGGPFTWANGARARFSIDPGPPRRAYFTLGAMADNSNGLLYDPTGRVLAAQGWGEGQRFTAPDDVRKLFGGDLLHCSHVRGDYYFCGFT